MKAQVLLSIWILRQWNLEAQLVLQGFLKRNSDTSSSWVVDMQEAFKELLMLFGFHKKSDFWYYYVFYSIHTETMEMTQDLELLWTSTCWHATV